MALEGAASLDRIRFVTRNYRWLQGLKIVPMGVLFVVWGAVLVARAGRAPDPALGRCLLLGLTGLGVAGYGWGIWHYRRVFGRVEQTREDRRRGLVLVTGMLVLGLVAGMTRSLARVEGPEALWACFAFCCLLYWRWTEGRLRHYFGVALASVGLAVLEAVPGRPLERWFQALVPNIGFRANPARTAILIGVVSIVLGLLDHRVLRETLREPDADEDDAPGAAA